MDDTKRNEIGATVFAILLGLSAMFFTGWLFTAGGCSDQRADHEVITNKVAGSGKAAIDNAADKKGSADLPEVAALQAKLDAAKLEIDAEAARRAELAAQKLELETQLKAVGNPAALELQVKKLQAEVDALQNANQVKLDGAMNENSKLEGKLAALTASLGLASKAESDLKLKVNGFTGKLDAAAKAEADLKAQLAEAAKAEADLKTKLAAMGEKAGAADMATAEADKLKVRVADLEKKLNDAGKAKLAMTAEASDTTKKLQAEFDAMKAKSAADAKAAADKMAAAEKKLADAEKKLADSSKAMAASAGDAAKKLQGELDAMKAKSAADAKAAADKLAAAEKKLADSTKAMTANAGDAAKKLQAQLDAANKKAKTDGDAWNAAKAKLNATNGDLQKQIDALKKQLAAKPKAMAVAAPAGALAAAGAGLPELDLPLLVNDPAKLDPKFKDLFVNLRSIEDSTAAREKAYEEISGGGKYEPSLRIPFGSGSDYISTADNKKIEELVKEAGPDAKFLAVGYASTDGSNETNYKLSSQRASNVGKKLADGLGAEENVQAVYFGQTARFSAQKSPNRIVEIWRVK